MTTSSFIEQPGACKSVGKTSRHSWRAKGRLPREAHFAPGTDHRKACSEQLNLSAETRAKMPRPSPVPRHKVGPLAARRPEPPAWAGKHDSPYHRMTMFEYSPSEYSILRITIKSSMSSSHSCSHAARLRQLSIGPSSVMTRGPLSSEFHLGHSLYLIFQPDISSYEGTQIQYYVFRCLFRCCDW